METAQEITRQLINGIEAEEKREREQAESISSDELEYLQAAVQELAVAQRAFDNYRTFLSRKYGLTNADQFSPKDGRITRGSQIANSIQTP